jgi:predicted DCC family thiol-disulfide oxidoreductase YuxK
VHLPIDLVQDNQLPAIRSILRSVTKLAGHIVLYDGVCHLCTGAVRFIIKRDPSGLFRFVSLQSETGKALLRQHHVSPTEVGSVMLIVNGNSHVRSDAVLLILRQLSGGWRLLSFLRVVPRPLRDFFYRLVARFRYQFFGKRATCLVALPGSEDRFLG